MAEGPKNFFSARSKALLEGGSTLELLSLHPFERSPTIDETLEPDRDPATFRGWHLLGRLVIKEPAKREQMITALQKGVDESDGNVAACFWPRHGVRAISDDGRVLDLVICFECASILVFEDREKTEIVTVTGSPERVLDQLLSVAGIQLAEKSG